MADPKADKKIESITALKNANKHLDDIFKDLAKKDLTMKTVADDLQRVATQCGDIMVMVYVGQNRQATELKKYLAQLATFLFEAR